MGVLSCDRHGCENIMYDRYSPKYGYLCNECFDELVAKGANASYDKWDEEFPTR